MNNVHWNLQNTRNKECFLTQTAARDECREPGHVGKRRSVEGINPGELRDPTGQGQRAHGVHSPQNQLAVDGVGILDHRAQGGAAGPGHPGRECRLGESRAGGVRDVGLRRPQGVVVRGGEEQRQQRVARQVVEVEAVAAVARLVGDAEDGGEGRVLGEADGPLVERAVGVFGDHEHVGGEDAEPEAAAGRHFPLAAVADQSGFGLRQGAPGLPLPAVLDCQIHIFVAGVHHHAVAQGDGVACGECHWDAGHEGHLERRWRMSE